jgi:glycosidase
VDFIPYNSYNTNDKSVFGSVAAGQSVRFSASLPAHYQCLWMNLVLCIDGGTPVHYPMEPVSDKHNRRSTEIRIEEPGLYWYYFEYETDLSHEKITRSDLSRGQLGERGAMWQLTVYSRAFQTPAQLKGGVMYQIFPDRFRFSKTPKEGIPYGRILRSDWGSTPEWRRTVDGKILNNDYFCGDFSGITQSLSYIASLGVTCIYLNPIFEAHSNHRYDTADYMSTDPLLGTEEDFKTLCKTAKTHDISIILDGVFSHTGADSIYFNKYNRYPSVGAYNSKDSKYYQWYRFRSYPDDYACWWNVKILPEIDEENEEFIDFITAPGGVVSKWMRLGAAGFRIDVADELPDKFLDALRRAVKRENPEGLLLGEVWEDASNKISHGGRRRYLLGEQLDSVMNYPFREAIIAFAKEGGAELFLESISSIIENYPPPALHLLMNHLGTHDTERVLTVLSGADLRNESREWQSTLRLTKSQKQRAKQILKLASVLQYTLPGIPSLYYGDEAGMEGGRDPFNRGCFPWENEDKELTEHFAALGALRTAHTVFREGMFAPLSATAGCVAFCRRGESETILVIANKNEHEITYYLPPAYPLDTVSCIFGGKKQDGGILAPANTALILACTNDASGSVAP